MTSATIDAIYRYPVKGLTPERLSAVELSVGKTLPADRRYAIENGPSGFDPSAPAFFPKTRFLMLMKNERLAKLHTRYDDVTDSLTIHMDGKEILRGEMATPQGRQKIEAFFAEYCADELNGPPKVLVSPGHSFSDVSKKVVSIINLASVAELEKKIGAKINPLRFRANLYVAGWPAWHEFDLLDTEISAGTAARLKIVKRIVRCPATNVDPDTGARDLTIPEDLKKNFGHMDCGIYGEIITAGTVAPGDNVK
jgi:uncharacterized protein YcbX